MNFTFPTICVYYSLGDRDGLGHRRSMPIPHAPPAGRPSSRRFGTLCHGVTLLGSRRSSAAVGGSLENTPPLLAPRGISSAIFAWGLCVATN